MTSSPSSISDKMEENDGLAARNHDDFIARDLYSASAADIFGDSLTQVGQTSRRTIMRPALAHGVGARLDDVGGRVEIGLADFQVDDAFALPLKGAGLIQNFKGGFGTETRHAPRKL